MIAFFYDLIEFGFLRTALIACLLASVSGGIVGSCVVARRISYVAGGISHCVLGGMGAARYAQVALGWQWSTPALGALVAALVAALVIAVLTTRGGQREDTVIGAVWSVGMATGILFISRTPGYNEDLMAMLLGNVLYLGPGDLIMIGFLDLVVVIVAVLFYHQLLAVCFDEEFARVRGINVERQFCLLLVIVAVTVVLMVYVVGIVMAIALLTLPAAVAGRFARTLGRMMIFAVILCACFTTGGLALSYQFDLPAGATIVLVAGAAYLLVTLGGPLRKRIGLARKAKEL